MDLRRACCPLLAGALVVTVHSASAATGQEAATAQALFEEGKRLMTDGKLADACPKLAESQRLDPAAGTMLALALCHEQEGKTATAWAEFSQVLTDSRKDHRTDREQAAQQHIAALERKLTRVNVIVSEEVPGIEVRRDGTLLGKPQWRLPLPVDPGAHAFEASAPGKTTWRSTVDVRGEGITVDVTVPALANAPTSTPSAVPPSSVATPSSHASSTVQEPPPRVDGDEGSSQRTIGLIVGGVGVAALAVGGIFGLRARSLWNDAKLACPNNGCNNPSDVTKAHDAGSAADLSSVFLIGGAAGLVTGAILFFAAPSGRLAPTPQGLRVTPTLGGLSVSGTL